LYAIIREAGPGWTDGKGAFDQPGASDHAAFMNALADDGVVFSLARSRAANKGASVSCS
jgi:hypothetical protein